MGVLTKLDHNPAAAHLLSHCASCSGTCKRIENKITRIACYMNYAIEQSFRLRRDERFNLAEYVVHLLLCFVRVSNLFVGPPCPRNETLNLVKEANDIGLTVIVLAKVNPSSLLQLEKFRFNSGPAPSLGGRMNGSSRSNNFVHLVRTIALRGHWNTTPSPPWVMIGILVDFGLLRRHWHQIPCGLKALR